MVKVQVSLPFSSSIKLTDDQKAKLIRCQGKRLRVDEVELSEIIRVCRQNGWLNNGLAFVYEYAGSIDSIADCANKLLLIVKEAEGKFRNQDLVMINMTMINYSFILLRLLTVVYQWRNLQCIPRPIYLQDGHSVLSVAQFIEAIGKRMLKVMKSTMANSTQKIPWYLVPDEFIVGILSSSNEFKSILEMSSFFLLCDGSDEVSQSRQYTFYFAMKELLDIENRIVNDWKIIKLEHSKLPTLRFPFITPPTSLDQNVFAWFSARQQHFSEVLPILSSISTSCENDILYNDRYSLVRHVLPAVLLNPCVADIFFWDLTFNRLSLITVGGVNPVILQLDPKETIKRDYAVDQNTKNDPSSPLTRKPTKEITEIVRSTTSASLGPESELPSGNFNSNVEKAEDLARSGSPPFIAANFETRAIRSSSAIYDHDLLNRRSPTVTPQRGRFYSADVVQSASKGGKPNKEMASAVQMVMSPMFSPINQMGSSVFDIQTSLLHAAFINIESRNWNPTWTAAGKIAVWYRLLAPRQKLLRRLYGRRCIQEVINDMIDNALRTSRLRQRRKRDLLRQGAAVKIQRAVKNWLYITREQQREIEEFRRMQQTIALLSKWKYAVLTAVRLWKIIMKFHLKRTIADSSTIHSRQPKLSNVLRSYLVLYSLKERAEQDKEVRSRPSEKFQKFRAIERAIGVIQKLVKQYIVRKRLEKAKFMNDMGTRITLFLIKCLAVRKVRQKRKIFESATKIQKFLRGVQIRRQVYRIVSSGLRLNACCRKYIAYKGLKSQLRRVDRPLTIQLHGLRNIAERLVNTGHIRVKISVWWNPLLHIVGHNDFHAILQSKRPQFVFESSTFKTAVQDESDNVKIEDSQNNRKQLPSPNKSPNIRTVPVPNQRQSRMSLVTGAANSSSTLPAITSPGSGRGRSPGMNLTAIQEKHQAKRTFSLSSYASNEVDEQETNDGDDHEHDEDRENMDEDDSNRNSSNNDIGITRTSFTEHLKTLSSKKSSGSSDTPTERSDSPNKFSVVRGTLNFAMRLGHAVQRQQSPSATSAAQHVVKHFCNFEDLNIKIPGCHGNSVIKFELLDGDRKIGNCLFYLGKESGMMYWGGDYQREVEVVHQKRAVQFNSNVLAQSTDRATKYLQNPMLDFRLVAGAPLRSRCQWGRLIVRGSGPLKRALQSQDIISHLTIFDNWRRFYMSLDEFGLFFFENKFSNKPFASIPVVDFKTVAVDNVVPVRSQAASKSIVEDITSVVLTTKHGDEVFMRFPDAASRIAWFEVFNNVVSHNKKSSHSIKQKGWFAKSFGEFANSFSRTLNLSPLKLRSSQEDDDDDNEEDDEEPVMLPSQIARSRKTLFGSTHNIF